MTMKLEESEDKVNEAVKQRMKDLHNKGKLFQYCYDRGSCN